MDRRLEALLAARRGAPARWAPWVRGGSAIVLIVFGLGKFVVYDTEVDAFERYGLPEAGAVVIAIGVIEVLGGVLLGAGLLTRVVALVLAGNMLGAIVLSGILEGEVVPSLTLAPALLAAMLFLIWSGAGKPSLDAELLEDLQARSSSR